MQVKIKDKTSIKKVLSFEILKEEVNREIDTAYRELKKKVDIKGFRKGKVPRKVLENRFFKDVHSDVASRLIQKSFAEAIEENELKVVGSPQVDPPKLESEAPYAFDITVEVKPELDDIEFHGIGLEKKKYNVSDAEIESQIYMIQKTMAKKETVKEERGVREGDYVVIDYEGFLDGEPFDKTPKIENYVMAVGSKAMPKEFSERLIGVIPVQSLDEVEVPYAPDYYDESLKGKTILYKIMLKEIREEILPEVNDELVKNLGKFDNLDELRKSIHRNLEKGYSMRVRHELSEQIFKNLLGKYEFEVPKAMIEAELEGIAGEAEQAYAQNNMTLEEAGLSRDILKTKYRDIAQKQARRHLILNKIIDQEKIELTDVEFEKSFEEMAKGMNVSVDFVKEYFTKNKNQLEHYKYTQLEKKAVNLIIEKGCVTEVEPDAAEDSSQKEER